MFNFCNRFCIQCIQTSNSNFKLKALVLEIVYLSLCFKFPFNSVNLKVGLPSPVGQDRSMTLSSCRSLIFRFNNSFLKRMISFIDVSILLK